MSWSVYSPKFPSLTPRPTDPLWFTVDKPVDEETELAREEAEQSQALEKISKQGSDLTPIGKNGNDQIEENEEEEDVGKLIVANIGKIIEDGSDSDIDEEDFAKRRRTLFKSDEDEEEDA